MGKKLYVGNIPWSVSEDDLVQLFEQSGEVTKASIVTDRETGRSRGFAFIEMADEESAQVAIETLDGTVMGSGDRERKISVTIAREKTKEFNSRGGNGGGRSYGNR